MNETVGIAAIGYYIPSDVMTGEAIAKLANIPLWVLTEKIGMEEKSIAAAHEQPSDMGIKAAISAINKAQVKPEAIDLIAYCGVGDYDYRFWSPAALKPRKYIYLLEKIRSSRSDRHFIWFG